MLDFLNISNLFIPCGNNQNRQFLFHQQFHRYEEAGIFYIKLPTIPYEKIQWTDNVVWTPFDISIGSNTLQKRKDKIGAALYQGGPASSRNPAKISVFGSALSHTAPHYINRQSVGTKINYS